MRAFKVIALLLCAGGVVVFIWWYFFSLPEVLFDKPYAYKLVDKNNTLLNAQIAKDEQWRFSEITSVPEKYQTALVWMEDKRFFEHSGVDGLALLRAVWLNLKNKRVVSGASTISMQVVRLSRDNPPRTIQEKVLEILRAWRLESRYSKQDILRFYASYAPYGGNVVGLEAASWRYFSRPPEQLTWAETATLSVLPNNPALIHLGRNRSKLKNKRDDLLKRLWTQGVLNKLDYQLALQEPLPNKPHPLPSIAPHLLETLKAKNPNQSVFQTTLEAPLQKQLAKSLNRIHLSLAKKGIHNLALLVIDNKSFEVLAYVGNQSENTQSEQGQAIDMVQVPRSTGSTLKAFLFADMIEQGMILPESLVPDVAVNYSGFLPQNYNRQHHGAVTTKEALVRSLNIPMVNLLSQRGVPVFLNQLRQLGMSSLRYSADHYGLSLILGGGEVSLWELSVGYANLAHRASLDANHQSNTYLTARVLKEGKTQTEREATISSAAAWLTLDALREVGRPNLEGYWKKFSSSNHVAWKTGTSYGQRDAWAIGVTPEYTIGAWVGNASGEGNALLTGTKSAAPLLFEALNVLPKNKSWFAKPHWQMKQHRVCEKDGYLSNHQCPEKKVWGLDHQKYNQRSPNYRLVKLDKDRKWQVNDQCENTANMKVESWFVLPPEQAELYQKFHADYQWLPALRADCNPVLLDSPPSLSIVYPKSQSKLYLPVELDGQLSSIVLKAATSKPEQMLYWHLNNQFIGKTQAFHQLSYKPKAGLHRLVIVDEAGQRVEQPFEVRSKME
jgi:penicillin-binding protein 1C